MVLMQMDASMTIAPVLALFVSSQQKGHHNDSAELCMQGGAFLMLKSAENGRLISERNGRPFSLNMS